jgi:hypothetical protein
VKRLWWVLLVPPAFAVDFLRRAIEAYLLLLVLWWLQ